jgi:hypothetical protein
VIVSLVLVLRLPVPGPGTIGPSLGRRVGRSTASIAALLR